MQKLEVEAPWEVPEDTLATRIRSILWNNTELLANPDQLYPLSHALAGHCFVASEAYMVVHDEVEEGGRDLKPEHVTVEVPEPGPTGGKVEFSHWYLRDRDTDEVVDLTAEQFTEYGEGVEIPYDEGRGRGFGTRGRAGNRTLQVLDQLQWKGQTWARA